MNDRATQLNCCLPQSNGVDLPVSNALASNYNNVLEFRISARAATDERAIQQSCFLPQPCEMDLPAGAARAFLHFSSMFFLFCITRAKRLMRGPLNRIAMGCHHAGWTYQEAPDRLLENTF